MRGVLIQYQIEIIKYFTTVEPILFNFLFARSLVYPAYFYWGNS